MSILLLLLIFMSCEVPTTQTTYDGDRMVVFANINVNALEMDPIYISKSARLDYGSSVDELYIDDAAVRLEQVGDADCDGVSCIDCSTCWYVEGFSGYSNEEDNVRPYYKFDEDPNILPNTKYRLTVSAPGHDLISDQVIAETTTPIDFTLGSSANTYYGYCDNDDIQDIVNVKAIKTDNVLDSFMPDFNNVDTVKYNKTGCYTQGFWSAPYFYLDINDVQGNPIEFIDGETAIRTLTYALGFDVSDSPLEFFQSVETNYLKECKEPFSDVNDDGILNESTETFFDYNSDEQWGFTYSNAIYDTSFAYKAFFRDQIKRDDQNRPYLDNPFVWTAQRSPLSFMWLYFHYYGLQLIQVQLTDQAYVDYLSGLSIVNPFVMGTSNFDEGYGLFSSTYSKYFYVFLDRPDDGLNYNTDCIN